MSECIVELGLTNVCYEIMENYDEISKELKSLSEFIEGVWELFVAYKNKELLTGHLENFKQKECLALRRLSEKLDWIEKSTSQEFFQHIDFINIKKSVLDANEESTLLDFIIRVKKILPYLTYQFERIKNAKTVAKQIIIIKGMI